MKAVKVNNEILEELYKTINLYKNKTLKDIFISFEEKPNNFATRDELKLVLMQYFKIKYELDEEKTRLLTDDIFSVINFE